jgi:hypothetical protein
MTAAVAFACGLLFAVGLGLSGMLLPSKIIGFLDVTGAWDPSLLFVMMGAVPVSMAGWFWRRGRSSPFGCEVPGRANHALDTRLFVGASLFGVGWGISGVCPGPAVTNLAAPSAFTLGVLGAMAAGVLLSLLLPKRVR